MMPSPLSTHCGLVSLRFPPAMATADGSADLLWRAPSAQPGLAAGEVHVWRTWLEQWSPSLDQAETCLAEDERARAAQFRFEKDRTRYVARRAVLREILGSYLRMTPAHLRFTCGPAGKPRLSFPPCPDLHFNVSHSDGLALYAVTSAGPVGIDVEHLRLVPESEIIATQFFPARAASGGPSSPGDEREQSRAFLQWWTRTEAAGKASGRGIVDLRVERRAEIAPDNGREIQEFPREKSTESLMDLIPAPDYVASIAIRPRSPNVNED